MLSYMSSGKLGVNRNGCGKTALFLSFIRYFTASYVKIKKYCFFYS